MKPSASAATRCFSCGYVDGRQLNDPDLMSGIVNPSSVQTLHVRQTADGGDIRTGGRDRRHMGGSAADIAYNNSLLEKSAQGR